MVAGEEITISYCRMPHDRTLRRQAMIKGMEFICACDLCKKIPHLALPEGLLRQKALKQIKNPDPDPSRLSSIQDIIEEVFKPGLGYGIYPMKELHEHVLRIQGNDKKRYDALKTAFRIYYLVQVSLFSHRPAINDPFFSFLVNDLSFKEPRDMSTALGIRFGR
jgi:hypothetical protein